VCLIVALFGLSFTCRQAFFIFNQKGEVSREEECLQGLFHADTNNDHRSLFRDCTEQTSSIDSVMTVYHLNQVLTRFYRRSIADVFRIQVVSNNEVRSPIVTLGSTSFFHVRVNNLYILAVTKYAAPCYSPSIISYRIILLETMPTQP
jgi:hypothetical protein